MLKNACKIRYLIGLIAILGALSLGSEAILAQEGDTGSNIQDLIVNGGFEGGFQEDFGIGYGWGGFSNGNAVVGWNFDDWDAVVTEGQYSQRIEITDAAELDRYAGIFQSIPVVPGEQYKLTINGLVRSTEGDVDSSDYGYRLQYAIDPSGGTAWELLDPSAWQELPWDEQEMTEPISGPFENQTFETTVTATGDQLTVFIRGWKKWINDGSGVYNIDEVSFVGPAQEGFMAPATEPVGADTAEQPVADEFVAEEPSSQLSEQDGSGSEVEQQTPAQSTVEQDGVAEVDQADEFSAPAEANTAESQAPSKTVSSLQPLAAPETGSAQLPESGQGSDDSSQFVFAIGAVIILVLLAGAITATVRRRHLV
jgi:hypothetical protein